MSAFILGIYGKVENFTIYNYVFNDQIIFDVKLRLANIRAILNSNNVCYYSFSKKGFSAFHKCNIRSTTLFATKIIEIKADNTQFNSFVLKSIFTHTLLPLYSYDRIRDLFVYSQVFDKDLKIVRVFKLDIKMFSDGTFFVHLDFKTEVFHILKSNFITVQDLVKYVDNFHLINLKRVDDHVSISLTTKNLEKNLENLHLFCINAKHELVKIFYPTLHQSIDHFFKIQTNEMASCTQEILHHLLKVDTVLWGDKNIQPFKLKKLNTQNHIIGQKFKTNQLSLIYHYGIFKQVHDKKIVLIHPENLVNKANQFENLFINHFNKNGTGISFHKFPYINFTNINLPAEEKIDLAIIFTEAEIQKNFLKSIKHLSIRYQIIGLPADQYALSNAVVKSQTAIGGIVSMPIQFYDCIYLGIDLGHSHQHFGENYSNLAMIFLDGQGNNLLKFVKEKIILNEALQYENLLEGFKQLERAVKTKKLKTKQLIIHRDGIMLKHDCKNISEAFRAVFHDWNLDIISICKSNVPALVIEKNGSFQNVASGDYFLSEKKEYAILVTTDMANSRGELNQPISIEKHEGILPLQLHVELIYQLCKLYISTIYYCNKIPKTTYLADQKANTKQWNR